MKPKFYHLFCGVLLFCSLALSSLSVHAQYCTPSYSNGSGFGNFITKVELDSLNDSTQALSSPYFSYDTTKTTTLKPGSTYTVYIMPGTSGFGSTNVGVFIDFNGDGDYADNGEKLGQLNGMAVRPAKGSITFTVPCTATEGKTRIRVASAWNQNNITPCGNFSWGETQDYKIYIGSSKLELSGITADQPNTLSALRGGTDQDIMRVKMTVIGCSDTLRISELYFNTAGSTNAGDIDKAHAYFTGGNSSFGTGNEFGNASNPSGSYLISGSQDLAAGDNYFWLSYDVASGATLGHLLDAEIDSFTAKSTIMVTNTGAISGNRSIDTAAVLQYVIMSQTDSTPLGINTTWNMIMGIEINMSAGASQALTELRLNTTGTNTPSLDLAKATVFYTGNSNLFDTTQQFGSTNYPNGKYKVTGSLPLLPGSNYFWVAYDIPISATPDDSVDAWLDTLVIAGSPYTATNGGMTSQRIIINSYCFPVHQAGCANSRDIEGIKFSNLDNTNSGCSNMSGAAYSDYSASYFIVNLNKGNKYTFTAYNSAADQTWSLWIDYNHDGTFGNSEWTQIHSGNYLAASDSINTLVSIPCTAKKGYTKMRVRTRGVGGPAPNGAGDACTTFGSGEAEDYVVFITDNKISAFTTEQSSTLSVVPGLTNVDILRIPLIMSSCGGGSTLTAMNLNTNGTTDTGDIKNTTIYYTGASSVFSTANSFGSLANPTTTYQITGSQNLLADTNYLWVAYDVDSPATYGNFLDAELSQVTIGSVDYMPTISAPAGSRKIDTFMTISNVTITQPIQSSVFKGSNDNLIIAIKVDMTNGTPVSLTSMNLSTNGSTNAGGDIGNARLYYTGNSSTFATTTQAGLNTNPVTTYNIASNISLLPGSNYFWLAYDVNTNAKANDMLDAELISITAGGVIDSVSNGAPTGNRIIENQYCTPTHTQTCGQSATYINGVKFNTLNNQNSGCTSLTGNKFNDYSKAAYSTKITKQINYRLKVTNGTNAEILGMWLDVNQNGTFDVTEFNQISTNLAANATDSSVIINIPCTAPGGWTKMRIRSRQIGGTLGSTDACTQFGTGETEDYWIYVQDNPNTGWLGNDKVICQGSTLNLTPGNFTTYKWSTGDTTQFLAVTAAGTYYVTATNGNCSGTDTVVVTTKASPSVNLGNDTNVCLGSAVTLNAGAGNKSYNWSTGDTTQSITVNQSGSYSVTVSNSIGCTATDTVKLTAASASVSLGNDTIICKGNSVMLDAGTQTSYNWSTGANTQTISVTQSGNYSVSVVNSKGCTGSDTVMVTVSSTSVTLQNDTTVCVGSPVTIDASSGYTSYAWNTGSTSQSITGTQPGTYTVTVTNQYGCSAMDSMKIMNNALPVVNLGNDTTICTGNTYTLDAGTSGNQYAWSIGANTQTISVANAGVYSVKVTNANNCISYDTIKIATSTAFVWAGNDIAFCDGHPDTLKASTGSNLSYMWNTGATTYWTLPATQGTYYVTATNQFGCKATDSVFVTVYPKPDPSFSYTFNGGKINFSPSNTSGSKYLWDFGNGNFSTLKSPYYIYPDMGNFRVKLAITSPAGCEDTLSKTVVINGIGAALTEQYHFTAFPNPFADEAVISYELPRSSQVNAELYDLTGKKINTLYNGNQAGGKQQLVVNASTLSNGTYLVKLTIDGVSQTLRITKQW